ncbi:MAG: hypothetical protein ACRYGO_17215 [Janthinobacterium lividum]
MFHATEVTAPGAAECANAIALCELSKREHVRAGTGPALVYHRRDGPDVPVDQPAGQAPVDGEEGQALRRRNRAPLKALHEETLLSRQLAPSLPLHPGRRHTARRLYGLFLFWCICAGIALLFIIDQYFANW